MGLSLGAMPNPFTPVSLSAAALNVQIMALYVKVFTSFYTHRKTLRLVAAIGNDAFWVPPRLWAYAAGNQPDGVLQDYSARELSIFIGYSGEPEALLQALLQAGFLDSNPLRIHDWQEHNNYHSAFADRAKKAAAVRWAPKEDKEKIGDDKRGEEPSIPPSNACSIGAAKPPPQSDGEWLDSLAGNQAYAGIDVHREFQKMAVWCQANGKQATRRRFVNWLNKADKPVSRQASITILPHRAEKAAREFPEPNLNPKML